MTINASGSSAECRATSSERRTWRNTRATFLWALVFVASFLAGKVVFENAAWAPDPPLAWVLSALPLIPGALAFRAFLRFFREADEMIREIYVEGLLYGVAAVMVFWGAIQLPEHVWLAKVRADTVITVLLGGFCFGIIRAGRRRK